MKHLRLLFFLGAIALTPNSLWAQAGGSKVGVIDFERAVVENVEGKKAAEQWNAKVSEKRVEIEKKQKEFDELENKLRTQERALSDSARAALTRSIDQKRTDLARLNEDAQKDLNEFRQGLFRPIAEKTTKVLNAYAAEHGYTVILDVSNPQSGVIFAQDVADITTEIIRRVDAELAKPNPPKPPAKPSEQPSEKVTEKPSEKPPEKPPVKPPPKPPVKPPF